MSAVQAQVNSKFLSADLGFLTDLAAERWPKDTFDRTALKEVGKLVARAQQSGRDEDLSAAHKGLEKVWKSVPAEAYCASVRKTIEANQEALYKKAGRDIEIPSDFLSRAVPLERGRKSAGLTPAIAAALEIIPKKYRDFMARYEFNVSDQEIATIQSETECLDRYVQDSKKLDRATQIGQFDANSASCWLLAALSVGSQIPLNKREFMQQIRDFRRLAADPEARREAAAEQYFLMVSSYGKEKKIGSGTVPVGHQTGCMEGAFLEGAAFAVRYDPSERAYYIKTPYQSLGLEKHTWKEKGSGPVQGSPRHVKCETYQALQEALPAVMKTLADKGRVTMSCPRNMNELMKCLMIDEIRRADPDYLPKFLERWDSSRRPKSVLIEACLCAGTFHPQRAFERIKIRFSSVTEVPEYKKFEAKQTSRKKKASQDSDTETPATEVKRVAFKSAASGIMTTGRVYLAVGRSGHSFWIGWEGLIGAVEDWAPDRRLDFEPEELRKRHVRNLKDTLREIQAAGLEETEISRSGRKYDPLAGETLKQRLAILADVNNEILVRLGEVGRLEPPQQSGLIATASRNFNLRMQDTATVIRWLEDEANLEKLSEKTRTTVNLVLEGQADLSDPETMDEVQEAFSDLYSQYDLTVYANRDAALGPVELDLQWYGSLPDNHPLRKILIKELGGAEESTLRAQVSAVRDAAGPALGKEVVTAYNAASIASMRRHAINLLLGTPESKRNDKEYLATYKGHPSFTTSELHEAIRFFEPLWLDKSGIWIDRKEVSGWERIKLRVEGKVLSQRDCSKIREVLAAYRVNPDEESAQVAKPIKEAIDAICGIIKSYRVVKNLNRILEEERTNGNLPKFDPENIGDALKEILKKRSSEVIGGSTVCCVEEFEGEMVETTPSGVTKRTLRYQMTLPEVLARVGNSSSSHILSSSYNPASRIAWAVKNVGVYPSSTEGDFRKILDSMHETALAFTPTADPVIQGKLEQLQALANHPLVFSPESVTVNGFTVTDIFKRSHISGKLVRAIDATLAHKEKLDADFATLGLEADEFRSRVQRVFGPGPGYYFISGKLSGSEGQKVLNAHGFHLSKGPHYHGEISAVYELRPGILGFRKDTILDTLAKTEREYVKVDADWIARAKSVVDPLTIALFKRTPYHYNNIELQLDDSENLRCHVELVAAVNKIWEALEDAKKKPLPPEQLRVALPHIGWKDNDMPVLNFGFGEIKGRTILDIATNKRSYFHNLKNLNPEKYPDARFGYLRRMAERIIADQIGKHPVDGAGKEKWQAFLEWLRKGAPEG